MSTKGGALALLLCLLSGKKDCHKPPAGPGPVLPSPSVVLPTTTSNPHHGHVPTPTGGPVVPQPTRSPVIDYPVPPGFPLEPRLNPENPKTPGARVVSQRTGPFTAPPMGEYSGFLKNVTAAQPCTKRCWLTAAWAGIEFEDGTEANYVNGPWLHHFVVSPGDYPIQVNPDDTTSVTPAPGTPPPPKPETCGDGKLHPISGTWGNGNERTVSRFNGDGTLKFGTELQGDEEYTMILEVMNESMKEQTFYVRIEYEVIDDPELMEGFKPASGISLDVAGCAKPDMAAETGKYSMKSPKWISQVSATLLYSTGHMHDGGVNMTIYKNGEPICTSEMLYGRTPGFKEGPDSHHPEIQHISDAGACRNFGTIEPGDVLHAEANYDADTYPLMLHDGMPHSSMGIALIFAGEP